MVKYLSVRLRKTYILLACGIFIFFSACKEFYGVKPHASASVTLSDADTYAFGNVTVGASATKTFTLTNSDSTKIYNLKATSLSSPYRFTGGTCPSELEKGESCTLVVEISPDAVQVYNDTLKVVFTNGDGVLYEASRPMTGTGITPASLSISDGTTYNYGRVVINQTANKTFTISNSGQSTATSLSPSISGTPYTLPGGGSCGSSLVGGATCTVIARYSPTVFAVSNDTLTMGYFNGVSSTSTTRAVTGTGVGASGTIDTTFATNGRFAVANLGSSADTTGASIITTDGSKIYTISYENFGQRDAQVLIRRNATDLSLDTSFGSQGWVALAQNVSTTLREVLQYDANRVIVIGDGTVEAITGGVISRYLSDGNLDTTFATNGKYYPGSQESIRTAYVQTDGKILFYATGGIIRSDGFYRLNSDGGTDASLTTFDPSACITQVYLDTSGKILASGYPASCDLAVLPPSYTFIQRYHTAGTLDTSFNTTGSLTYSKPPPGAGPNASECYSFRFFVDSSGNITWYFGCSAYDGGPTPDSTLVRKVNSSGAEIKPPLVVSSAAAGVVLQTDGRTMVLANNGSRFELSRINNAILDTSFQTSGSLLTTFGTGDTPTSIVQGAGDRHILMGHTLRTGGYNLASLVLNVDGTFDTSFNTNGKKAMALSSADAVAKDLVLDSTGRTYVSAEVFLGGTYRATLLRFNSNYTLDTTFSSDGIVYTTLGTSPLSTTGSKITLGTNGRIALAHNKGIALFKSDGTLDTSFATTGNYSQTGFKSSVFQVDGKLISVGDSGTKVYLARFDATGALDTSFRTAGKQTETWTASNSGAYSVLLLTDGSPVLAGYATTSGVQGFGVLRMGTGGLLDTSFATSGMRITTFGAGSVAKRVFESGSRLYVSGVNAATQTFAVARYSTDLILDTSFMTNGRVEHSVGAAGAGTIYTAHETVITTDGGVIVVGGKSGALNQVASPWRVARILSDGSLDTRFGTAGRMAFGNSCFGLFGSSICGMAWAVTTQTDGKHVLGGAETNSSSGILELSLYRLWP